MAWNSARSRSQIACNASAVALSCRLLGKAYSQAAYWPSNTVSAATASRSLCPEYRPLPDTPRLYRNGALCGFDFSFRRTKWCATSEQLAAHAEIGILPLPVNFAATISIA
jgi:hypothetical protein